MTKNNIDKIVTKLLFQEKTVAVAESCTGGLLAAAFTDVPGVSGCFKGGIVSYSNEIKMRFLGVPDQILKTVGAVSHECAKAMALGVRDSFGVNYALSTTGIAGPGGATPTKPVGRVYIGLATPYEILSVECTFKGSRIDVRKQAVESAVNFLFSKLDNDR